MTSIFKQVDNGFGIGVEQRYARHEDYRTRVFVLPVELGFNDLVGYTTDRNALWSHYSNAPAHIRDLFECISATYPGLIRRVQVNKKYQNEVYIALHRPQDWEVVEESILREFEGYLARWAM